MRYIAEFKGEHAWLSNFFESPVFNYKTVEHAFQASKTLDMDCRLKIALADTPGEAKRMGKTAPLRAGWNEMKINLMHELIREKFKNPELRKKLLATEDALIFEGNWWGDRFWGVDKDTLEGQNHLGKIIMEVRREIQDETQSR